MSVALIDYGSGNVKSALKALQNIAGGRAITLTNDPDFVVRADHIVLPGVGAFGDCATGLRRVSGMWDALTMAVIEKGRPFLGICVGMQLTCSVGQENGRHKGLGWIEGEVIPLKTNGEKIPHMGWNTLHTQNAHPVLAGLEKCDVYFVHSYVAQNAQSTDACALFDYAGAQHTACLARDTIFGTQFHPEKSQKAGLRLLDNFLHWKP